MDPGAEKYIAKAKAGMTEVRKSIQQYPSHWRSWESAVRTAITYIDQSQIMRYPQRVEEQAWLLKQIQDFACNEAENGGIRDIAAWCERGWDTILATDSYNIAALTGLGELWLARAQPSLARIYLEEGRSSWDDELSDAEAERRVHTPNYIEARNALQPAVEFLSRAVDTAHSQRRLTAPLLVKRAEASMSLGNVSGARQARRHFKDAVASLQAAANTPGYRLDSHLAQYLREHEYILRT